LRQGRFTTATMTRSYMAEARAITSRCPFVTGSNVPGHIAMRLSGAMDSDQGVAIATLVEQRQVELERCPPVALGHYPCVGSENRSQRRRELSPKGARLAIWRIEEHEIVKTSAPRCASEVGEGVL